MTALRFGIGLAVVFAASLALAQGGADRRRSGYQDMGEALQKISQEPDIARAMFEILETEKILESKGEIVMIPRRSGLLGDLVATGGAGGPGAAKG